MAEKGAELDLDVDAEGNDARTRAPRPWLKYLIIALSISLLLSGTALVTLYFAGALSTGTESAQAAAGSKAATAKSAHKTTPPKKPAGPVKYIALDPPFLVNFSGASDVRYLQVSIELSAYREDVLDAVKAQMPAIRNGLVLLLSSQDPAALSTRGGKDKLLGEVLDTVRQVLKKQAGVTGLQGAFFTSFVMQ